MLKVAQPDRPDALTWVFLGLGLLLLPVGLYLALSAPPDVNQGYLVRIMYLHVPGAWLGYLAFFVTFLYSLLYLFRRDPRHDRVASSSAEIGLVFMGLALVTGMLWARPTWGVYWTWEPRLTTTAILFAVYVGYFLLRGDVCPSRLPLNWYRHAASPRGGWQALRPGLGGPGPFLYSGAGGSGGPLGAQRLGEDHPLAPHGRAS